MKKIYTAILAFLAFTIVSCEKNEGLLIPQPFSDFAYTVTGGYYGNAAGVINFIEPSTVASFMHISQGALSHEWSISDDCHFLTKDFTDDTKDYTPFIKKGKTSKDPIAFVLFEKGGMHKVTIRAFFADSVADYKPSVNEHYTQTWNKEKGAFEMKVELDFKVMEDVNMAFDVFGMDLTTPLASVSLDQTGNEDSKNWPTIELVEGDSISIKFTEIIGDPVELDFTHEAGETVVTKDLTSSKASIVYLTPGEYTAGTVMLNRLEQEANNITPSNKEKTIPLNIVVKSKDNTTSPEVLP